VKEMLGAALAKRMSCSHGKARSLLHFLSPSLSFSSFTANLDQLYHREGDAGDGAGQEDDLQPLEARSLPPSSLPEYKNWSERRPSLTLKRITCKFRHGKASLIYFFPSLNS
jgi:hypothetical protein